MAQTISYSKDDSTEENTNLYSSDYDIATGSKERDSWFDELLKNRKKTMEVELIYHRKTVSLFLESVDTNSGNIRQFL